MAFLRGFGSYLPERVVANADLAPRIGKDASWILEMTGIAERRWAGPEASVAGLGEAAARDCLSRAGVEPCEVGALVMASGTSERRFPGPASTVAHRLGLGTAPAIDLPVASAGALFGMALAARLTADYPNVLVVAAEKMSTAVDRDPMDPNSGMLFGDGAGACLVSAAEGRWRVLDWVLHSDGAASEAIRLPLDGGFAMDGMAVIMHASRKIPAAISEALKRVSLEPGQVDQFLLHQANLNLLTRIAKSLGVPVERIFSNIARYGNTSSASMLIAAAEAGPAPGTLCFAAFGAGLHWGALVASSAAVHRPADGG